jgi:hypothetical protein
MATIENNYIRADPGTTRAMVMSSSAGPCLLRNNVIYGYLIVYNTNIRNNIWITGDWAGGGANQEDYNMCNGTQFTGPNSIQNANMNDIFVNNGGTVDTAYVLKCLGGNDGCGDGEFGHDMGMFGGPSPYILSGMPDIPAIFHFGGVGTTSPVNPLDVNMKSKSHN